MTKKLHSLDEQTFIRVSKTTRKLLNQYCADNPLLGKTLSHNQAIQKLIQESND